MRRPLPVCKPPEVLRALQRAGFFVHHTSGSHYILRHPDKLGLRITLPFHRKDLKRRVLASIVEQAGMTVEEFFRKAFRERFYDSVEKLQKGLVGYLRFYNCDRLHYVNAPQHRQSAR